MLNGPDALSTALLDVIGPEGTLLVYTSWDSVHDDLLDGEGRVLAQWRDHNFAANMLSSDLIYLLQLNAVFHDRLYAICGNSVLQEQIQALRHRAQNGYRGGLAYGRKHRTQSRRSCPYVPPSGGRG